MTAKHRKGKSNHKHEDNFFKNEVSESEVRAGGNNYILLLVLFLMIVIGGATGAWFCFQQHQTLTYLTDNLMGMQMKIVKLQSSQEELRQSSGKQDISENLETRLNALEESYALAQKQVSMALATAEQLKTSDLPAQVLSLHSEMKARLEEMQQATVSLEQLSQLQKTLKGKSEEFEGVRIKVEGLSTLSAQLSQKVDVLTENLGEAESKLEDRHGQIATISTTLDEQAAEVLRQKQQLDTYQTQLEASTLEMATVRDLLEKEQSQRLLQASVEEQLDTVRQSLQDQNSAAQSLHSDLKAQLENMQKQVTQLIGERESLGESVEHTEETPTDQETAAASAEEETLASDVEEEEEENEQVEEPLLDEAVITQEDTIREVAAPAEEVEAVKEDHTENDQSTASSENEDVDTTQTEEEVPEEEESEGEDVEESPLEEESHNEEEEVSEIEEAEEESHNEEEEMASEGEKGEEQSLTEEDDHKSEKVASERDEALKELLLEEDVAEWEEEQQNIAADQEVPVENDSSSED